MISDVSTVTEDVRKVTPYVAKTKEGQEGKYKILVAWDPATNRDVGWLTLLADSSKVDVGKLQFRNWNLASTKRKPAEQGVGMSGTTPPSKEKFHPVSGSKVFPVPENTNINKSFSNKPTKILPKNNNMFVPLASSSPMGPPVKPPQKVQSPDSEWDVSKDGRDKVSCKICQRMIGKKGMPRHMKTHPEQKINLNDTNVSMNSVNFSQIPDPEQTKKDFFFPEQMTRPKETQSAKSDLFKKDSVKTKKDHINPERTIRPEDTVTKKDNLINSLNEKPKKANVSKTFCKHYFFHCEKGKGLTIQTPTTIRILKAMKKFANEHGEDYYHLEFLTAKKYLLTGDELAGDVPREEISVRRRRFVEAEDVNGNPCIGDGGKAAVSDPLDLSNSWDSQVGKVKRRKVESRIDSMLGSYDPLNDSDSDFEEN